MPFFWLFLGLFNASMVGLNIYTRNYWFIPIPAFMSMFCMVMLNHKLHNLR